MRLIWFCLMLVIALLALGVALLFTAMPGGWLISVLYLAIAAGAVWIGVKH